MEIYPKLIAQNPALQLRKGGRLVVSEKIEPNRHYRSLVSYGTNSGFGNRRTVGFDDKNLKKCKLVLGLKAVEVLFFVDFYTFPASDLNPQYGFLTLQL
jgi:hypothetical protein